MRLGGLLWRIVWTGFAICLPVAAQLSTISTPTAAYTAGTTVIPIVGADGAAVTTLSGGGQAIAFSSSMTALTVGAPGGGGFWGSPPETESGTPRVLTTPSNETTLTITLGTPVNTFGF